MIISLFARFFGYTQINSILEFSESLFFFVWLPPIVFAAGYNMKRKKFFQHFNYVALFGVVGTFTWFTFFSFFTGMLFYLHPMDKYIPETGVTEKFELTLREILLLCSLMCSSDVVAAVSLIDFQKEPKLFSMVFGEGITNDAVSIILFNTVFKYTGSTEKFTAKTVLKVILEFTKLTLSSVGWGIAAAFAWALFLKHMRFLTHSPVHETMMVFSFGYLGYMFSELFELSGIITLLTSGILMAHYAWYNLSPQSKQTTSLAFGAIGFGAEAFVFAYLGLTFFSYTSYEWSWQFFIAEFFVIIIGRFLGIVGLLYLVSFLFNHERELSFKELMFLYCGGMIRGAIAFGLVLRLDHSLPNREVIITTSLWLVIVTTLLFGTLMPILGKVLLKKEEITTPQHSKLPNQEGKELNNMNKSDSFRDESSESMHEMFIHPNFDDGEASILPSKKKKKSTWVKYFKEFDETILKPILIYKYSRERKEKQFELYDLMQKKGINIEQAYANKNSSSEENKDDEGKVMNTIKNERD